MVTRAVPGSYVCDFKIHHTPVQIQMRIITRWAAMESAGACDIWEREREMKWWEQQRWVSNVSSLVLWWGGRSEVWVIDTLRTDLINACARIHQQAVVDAIFRGLKVYEAYIFTENKFMTTVTICCTTLIRYERQKWLKSCFKNDPTFLAFFPKALCFGTITLVHPDKWGGALFQSSWSQYEPTTYNLRILWCDTIMICSCFICMSNFRE